MRTLLLALLLGAIAVSGCAKKKNPSGSTDAAKSGKPVVRAEKSVLGRVAKVNEVGRFVVLNFATGKFPAQDQKLVVYRRDVKVAELKATGPQNGENMVADIVSGEPELNDEVREN